jgi:hypothetical protein
MAKQRKIRDELRPRDDALLVRAIYGAYPDSRTFDRQKLIDDVAYNFTEFGYHGLSLWLVSELWPLERVLIEKTSRAKRVALFRARALVASGLGLVPSGRYPHYDTSHGSVYGAHYGSSCVTAGSSADLVDLFLDTPYAVVENSYYAQDPS